MAFPWAVEQTTRKNTYRSVNAARELRRACAPKPKDWLSSNAGRSVVATPSFCRVESSRNLQRAVPQDALLNTAAAPQTARRAWFFHPSTLTSIHVDRPCTGSDRYFAASAGRILTIPDVPPTTDLPSMRSIYIPVGTLRKLRVRCGSFDWCFVKQT